MTTLHPIAERVAQAREKEISDEQDQVTIERDRPFNINGVDVEPSGEPLEIKGEKWQTMVPVSENDERLWEFGLNTGRIIRTRG